MKCISVFKIKELIELSQNINNLNYAVIIKILIHKEVLFNDEALKYKFYLFELLTSELSLNQHSRRAEKLILSSIIKQIAELKQL